LQDPGRNSEDPEAGKFKWDGKPVANPAVLGTWTAIAFVPSIDAFNPAKPVEVGRAQLKISPIQSLKFGPRMNGITIVFRIPARHLDLARHRPNADRLQTSVAAEDLAGLGVNPCLRHLQSFLNDVSTTSIRVLPSAIHL
jgi:hypothetical protein